MASPSTVWCPHLSVAIETCNPNPQKGRMCVISSTDMGGGGFLAGFFPKIHAEIKMNSLFSFNLCGPCNSSSAPQISSLLLLPFNKWMKSCSCLIKYACLICFYVHISRGEGVVVRGPNLLMRGENHVAARAEGGVFH